MQPVLHFVVNNQIITRTDTFVPVRNSRNYLYAEFEFKTEDWAGVSKIALFHNEGNEQISIFARRDEYMLDSCRGAYEHILYRVSCCERYDNCKRSNN